MQSSFPRCNGILRWWLELEERDSRQCSAAKNHIANVVGFQSLFLLPQRTRPSCFAPLSPLVFALVFCDTILKVSPSVFPVNSVLLILLGFSWIPAIPAHPKLVWSLTVLASSPKTQSSLTSLIRTIYLCGFSLSLCLLSELQIII